MAERPILFTGPMVRAILDGLKTQTRRVIKPQSCIETLDGKFVHLHSVTCDGACEYSCNHKCPYGKPGDLLYVRETWGSLDADHPRCEGGRKPQQGDRLVYRANPADDYQWGAGKPSQGSFVWRPSRFMPKWASRIWLRVTDVRVERVQEVTEEEAIMEGLAAQRTEGMHVGHGEIRQVPIDDYAICRFETLWNAINLKRGYGWDANPWVRVVGFERDERPAG